MKVYRIKESKLEDFKKNYTKFGFHESELINVFEYDNYKDGKLWVSQNGLLLPTISGVEIKSNDKVIKHLMSQGYLEIHHE